MKQKTAGAGMSREPMTYAERLHRLTVAFVLEKLQEMKAELAAEREGDATPSAGGPGSGVRQQGVRQQGPPTRNRKAPTRRREG